jgi:hypothetical protein
LIINNFILAKIKDNHLIFNALGKKKAQNGCQPFALFLTKTNFY